MVERYQSRIQVPVAQTAIPRVSTGAAVAQGVGDIARVGMDLASQRLRERAQADDAIAYAQAVTRYESGLMAIEREEQGRAGVGGSGYLEAVEKRRAQLQQEVIAGLPEYVTEIGRARITQAFVAADAQSRRSAAEWADQQNKAWRLDSIQEVLSARYRDVQANPDAARAAATEVGELIARAGLDPADRAATQRAAGVDITRAAVTGYLSKGRVDEALALIDEAAHRLTPAEQDDLDRAVRDWVEGQVGDVQADLADLHDREVSALLYGLEERDLEAADRYLRAHRDEMDPDDYGQHVKALRQLSETGPVADSYALTQELDLIRAIEAGEIDREELYRIERDGAADGRWDTGAIGRIESAWNAREDATMKAGLDVIGAAFGQSSMMAFDNALALSEAEARNALIEWRRANPQATRDEVREAAVKISAMQKTGYLAQLPEVGSYGRPATPEDVEAIKAQMIADQQAGALTLDEMIALTELLERYANRMMAADAFAGGL